MSIQEFKPKMYNTYLLIFLLLVLIQVCRTRAPRAATVETIECGGEEGGGLPGGATSAGSSTDVDFTLKNVEDVIGNGAVDSDQR